MIKRTDTVNINGIGTVICPQCNLIQPRSNYLVCGCGKCGSTEEPIIIDEVIAEIIVKLNNKGYLTHACCSGHAYPHQYDVGFGRDGYIAFVSDVWDTELLNKIRDRSDLFEFDYFIYPHLPKDRTVFRWGVKGKTHLSRCKNILSTMTVLNKIIDSVGDLK